MACASASVHGMHSIMGGGGEIIVGEHEKFSRPDTQIMGKQMNMENPVHPLHTSMSFHIWLCERCAFFF